VIHTGMNLSGLCLACGRIDGERGRGGEDGLALRVKKRHFYVVLNGKPIYAPLWK